MLTLNERLAQQATQEAIADYRALALKDSSKEYLKAKEFTSSFIDTLSRGQYLDRVKCIYDAKDAVKELAILYGGTYDEDKDALLFEDIYYFFGKIPEEFEPGKTITDLAQVFQAEAFDEALQKYLSQYWPKKITFKKLVDSGYAINVPQDTTLAMAIELERFNLTVEKYSQIRQKLFEEQSMLNQYLKAQESRQLYLEGLAEEEEDTSRSVEAAAKKEFFNKLDGTQLILYFLSRKVDMMLRNANPFLMIEEFDTIYSLEQMRELVRSVKDIEYDASGTKKVMGPFNRILRFWDFYNEGIIDREVLKYLTIVNDWVLNQFINTVTK